MNGVKDYKVQICNDFKDVECCDNCCYCKVVVNKYICMRKRKSKNIIESYCRCNNYIRRT